MKKMTNNMKI